MTLKQILWCCAMMGVVAIGFWIGEVPAGAGQCTCANATIYYNTIACQRLDGSTFSATQTCYVKHDNTTGQTCGTVCDAAVNVCAGAPSVCR